MLVFPGMVRFSIVFLLFVAVACSNPLPALEGVDTSAWKDDKMGCSGRRQEMETALVKAMDKLKGLSEMEVIELLGRPDENELYKRNQKFYFYYVTPGPDCPADEVLPRRLSVRFNAMGYAQLVSITTVRK